MLLVHEARGADAASERGVVSFDDILKMTPEHLGPGKGFYTMIAIALKAGAWREVSHVLVARELANGIASAPPSERAAVHCWRRLARLRTWRQLREEEEALPRTTPLLAQSLVDSPLGGRSPGGGTPQSRLPSLFRRWSSGNLQRAQQAAVTTATTHAMPANPDGSGGALGVERQGEAAVTGASSSQPLVARQSSGPSRSSTFEPPQPVRARSRGSGPSHAGSDGQDGQEGTTDDVELADHRQ